MEKIIWVQKIIYITVCCNIVSFTGTCVALPSLQLFVHQFCGAAENVGAMAVPVSTVLPQR